MKKGFVLHQNKFISMVFIGFALLFIPSVKAQKVFNDAGLVIYTLGNDTTLVQDFSIENKQFKTTVLSLAGSISKCEATGELDETGDLKRVNSLTYRLENNGNWTQTFKNETVFTGDSLIINTLNEKGTSSHRAFVGKGILANSSDIASFFVFPYMGFSAPTKIGDTAFHRQMSFNNPRPFIVNRYEANKLKIGSSLMGYPRLTIDEQGRLLEANAVGTSLNFMAKVDRNAKNNPQTLEKLAQQRLAQGGAIARAFRDTARLLVNDKKIEIDFWRPYRRGRNIFGYVVPWGRVWRTGANNATQLRTPTELSFGDNKLPAGKYALFSLPTENKWELIVNRKADNWGTDYEANADIFKVPLQVEKLPEPVEIFKITLTPLENKTVKLVIEWDFYRASTIFKVE